MNRPRAWLDRAVSWSPVFLLGGLAALTFWLDAQVQPPAPRYDGSTRHDPDLFVENFRAASFDDKGEIRQALAAKLAQHFPDDETTVFVSPALALTDPGKPRFEVTADKGSLSGDREIVTLEGDVRAMRAAARESPARAGDSPEVDGPVTFTTEYLRVRPKRGLAETDRAVTIEDRRGTIHGVGMVLDNQAKTMTLNSGVRGTLQPQRPSK